MIILKSIKFKNLSQTKNVFLIALSMLLISCGSSVDAPQPSGKSSTGINTGQLVDKVAFFPVDYFSPGYAEHYVMKGTDDYAETYVGTYEILTGDETVFNGVTAIPVASILSYSAIINGVVTIPMTVVLTQYYSSAIPRQYLGSVNSGSSLIFTLQDVAIDLPEKVLSSSSGLMANLIASNSSVEIIDWSVSDNNNDTYNLVFNFYDTDSAGGLIVNERHTFIVDSLGERLSWQMSSEIPSLNNTLKFSGIRQ